MSGNRSLRPRPRLRSDRAVPARPFHGLRPPTAAGTKGPGWFGLGPKAAPAFALALLLIAALGTWQLSSLSSGRRPGATSGLRHLFCALCTVYVLMWPIEQSGLRLSRRAAAGPADGPTPSRRDSCACRLVPLPPGRRPARSARELRTG
jgi:hypothetical protein